MQKQMLTERLARASRTAALLNARYSGTPVPDEEEEQPSLLHSMARCRLLVEKARLDQREKQLVSAQAQQGERVRRCAAQRLVVQRKAGLLDCAKHARIMLNLWLHTLDQTRLPLSVLRWQ